MTSGTGPGRLVALVADRDMEEALTKLFDRSQALGIRSFDFVIRRHPKRDAGCRVDASSFLRQFLDTCDHALAMLDRHGCGSTSSREEIEAELEYNLARNGWDDRARVVVIDPELEAWVWADSPAVAEALGWGPNYAQLRSRPTTEGFWLEGSPKPRRPKAAVLRALRSAPPSTRRRRSARLFGEIAASVSFRDCRDPAFQKLKDTLQAWYPDPE